MVFLWRIPAAFALVLSKLCYAQNIYGYGDEAGQNVNVDILEYGLSNCNRTNLKYYNASEGITVDAFSIPADVTGASVVANLTSLTFTAGVAQGPYAAPGFQNISYQQFWVTPWPYIDLSSAELPYYGCSTIIWFLTDQVNVNGQSDNGNCTTLFNQNCVDALLAQAKEMALSWSGQNRTDQNCTLMGNPPPACQQFGHAGGTPYLNITWLSDGLGAYDKASGIYNYDNVSSGQYHNLLYSFSF